MWLFEISFEAEKVVFYTLFLLLGFSYYCCLYLKWKPTLCRDLVKMLGLVDFMWLAVVLMLKPVLLCLNIWKLNKESEGKDEVEIDSLWLLIGHCMCIFLFHLLCICSVRNELCCCCCCFDLLLHQGKNSILSLCIWYFTVFVRKFENLLEKWQKMMVNGSSWLEEQNGNSARSVHSVEF